MSTLIWSGVTALFGGRFDPPHLGHREAVRGLFEVPGIKEVLIVPSASPPHKGAMASAEHRAEMARINFQPTLTDMQFPSAIRLDLRELERARRNPQQPSFSFDTLQELAPLYSSLAFVIGADQLKELPTWHRFPDILKLCHWIVLERKPYHDSIALETLRDWDASGLVEPRPVKGCWQIRRSSSFLNVVPTDADPVSSTKIRESLAKLDFHLKAKTEADPEAPPEVPDGLLPEVWTYLKKNRLYGI